jgi:OOP family OmpA-OmpF porin
VGRLSKPIGLSLLLLVLGALPALADDIPKEDEAEQGAPPDDPFAENPAPTSAPAVEAAPPVARRVVLRGIKFGSDTAYIEPASAGTLEAVAERLRENPQVRVRIEGHTDASASEEHNLELSKERADAVKRILVGFGVGPERIDTVGLGESQPIASNDTSEGRALNRRVELDVLE